MSSNLTESTRLAQSLTSSSTGTRRDWSAEAVNPSLNSSGLAGVSSGLSASSVGGANTIALGTENFATDHSAAVFQTSLGNYSSANSASAGPGLMGRTAGPIGPSSGMSYKAVTLSKPNPDSRKNSIYKLGDPHEDMPLATAGQVSLALGNSGLGVSSGLTTDKARAPSSSSSNCGRVASTSTSHNLKRGQADDSSDKYVSGKGGATNAGKGVSKGTSGPTDGTGKHAVLSEEQLATFRTSFCAKHHQNKCPNSDSCEKSHCLTWQRRNPYEISYCPHLCPEIQFVKKSRKMVLYRRCTRGKNCNFAHSKEEELYHPLVYKTKQCSSFPKCTRYFCPFVHDPSEMRDASKFMFEGYPATKGKGAASGAESGKEDPKTNKKGGSGKGSPGLVADAHTETERVEGVPSDSNKETYRESRQYLLQAGDYEEYGGAYAGYGEDYSLQDYANYDNEYGDEYNSQFAKDYPVYNKEYQDQFASSYVASSYGTDEYRVGDYGVGEQVSHLEKDQMARFENLDALDAAYGLDRVDRLDATSYYEDGLGVEGMWAGVDGYSVGVGGHSVGVDGYSVGDQLAGAEYEPGQQGYQRSYQSGQVSGDYQSGQLSGEYQSGQISGEYQSYQHSGYQQGYQHSYRRASYKDAYQRQYGQYRDYQADAGLSYGQEGRYSQEGSYGQSYQYSQDYADKEYYANYPDLPTSSANGAGSNGGSGLTGSGAGSSSTGKSNIGSSSMSSVGKSNIGGSSMSSMGSSTITTSNIKTSSVKTTRESAGRAGGSASAQGVGKQGVGKSGVGGPGLSKTGLNNPGLSKTGLNNPGLSKTGVTGLGPSSVQADSGELSTSYSNYNSADTNYNSADMNYSSGETNYTSADNYNSAENYHSPGESYRSSDNYQASDQSGYPSGYRASYSADYLEQASGADYLQSYYQDRELGLQYELEAQFGDLGLGGRLDMGAGVDRPLELGGGLDLSGGIDGGMELNDMFVKIINEIEK